MHRNVLIASSQYFKAMFNTEMKETIEQCILFKYNKNMFQLVLDYFYSGEILINKDNFADVLEISHYLQVCYFNVKGLLKGYILMLKC